MSRPGRWLSLLLVGVLGAGCLGFAPAPVPESSGADPVVRKVWTAADAPLSQPVFKKILFEALPFEASDGARIDVMVYRPETPADVKVPAIVHFSPYFADSLPRGGGNTDRILRDNFTARGYAVVITSVRGTGFSEGCFEIGGPRERQDAVELFEKIAQQPWSNGRVAAIGVSYDGTAPQGALVAGSPYLKTIVPIAAISEWYKYNFVKGVQINPQGYAFNTYYVAQESLVPNFHPLPGAVGDVPDDVAAFATRPCDGETFVDVQRAQAVTGVTGTTDPYWESRNFTRMLSNVQPNVSALVVHGLIDYNVKTHNLLPWYQELQAHGVATKILLGQWAHAYPGTGHRNARLDWNVTLLRWFDHWLKDIDTGIMDEPAAQIQDPAGVWREEDDFPPSRARTQRYYFNGLDLKDAPGSETALFVDGAPGLDPRLAGGVGAVYRTPVLEEDFRYTGEAVAHLRLKHTAPRGHVAVTVYDVDGSTWKAINWGFHSYTIRDDANAYEPVVPNEEFALRVPLLPTDALVKAGHRVAVVLSAYSAGGPSMLPPPSGGVTTVLHGPSTYIEFPTIDGITPMGPQPPMRGP